MKKSLIIHGHFYQPPREDPFTGIIQNQNSAFPHENWNESIYNSCYMANANSRYLSFDGRVRDIKNNYSNISFNFGPTLLNWLNHTHPELIEALVNADKDSISRLGYGNAIAQGYNHTILPLDSKPNRHLQIYWGIKSFEKYFSRTPEGFWCPECAINTDTIDELADNGIKYTILSPWQAKSIDGNDLQGKPASCTEPFILEGTNGRSISVFFYEPNYASEISFNHLLKDADALYNKIENTFVQNPEMDLLSWATDGEIYGHHEPFGDMALCALSKKIEKDDKIQLTNYASYLATHNPTKTVQLKSGDDNLGTSWSCSHGVGRWFRDCGCHTGGKEGWNQKWRTPLREAFQNLENEILPIFEKTVQEIFPEEKNAINLLEEFSLVTSKITSMETFIKSKNLPKIKGIELAKILDGIYRLFYSFTSCGWFFSDLAGIEPRQNIKNAIYAAKNFESYTDKNLYENLIKDLSLASSNEKKYGNGKIIAIEEEPVRPPFVTAADFCYLNRMLASSRDYENIYGFFELEYLNTSAVSVYNTHTLERYKVALNFKGARTLVAKDQNNEKIWELDIEKVSPWARSKFVTWIENALEEEIDSSFVKQFSKDIMKFLTIIHDESNRINHSIIVENRGLCLKCIRYILLMHSDFSWQEKTNILSSFISFVKLDPREEHLKFIQNLFNQSCRSLAVEISLGSLTDEIAEDVLNILQISRTNGFQPKLTELQEAIMPYLSRKQEASLKPAHVLRLFEDLNFSLEFFHYERNK